MQAGITLLITALAISAAAPAALATPASASATPAASPAADAPAHAGRYDSYSGLLMAGYQGWFNTPDDGAGRGWKHYNNKNGFRPGSAVIDFWPDVSEYAKTYPTEFHFADGSPARVFSSYDQSTVDTHFRWMKEYGIDGVFMQRFVSSIKNKDAKRHGDTVLDHAMKAALNYDRAICVMYDLGGMTHGDAPLILADIEALAAAHHFKPGADRNANPSYLWHNGKPLVALWGVGFGSRRDYNLDDVDHLIDALRRAGYSLMLGVPAYWRTLARDAVHDARLHALIKKADIIMPWFVGRYNDATYLKTFPQLIAGDLAWCKANNITYVPLCFPGFSWKNLKSGENTTQTPRDKGRFFWKQLATCAGSGATSIYVAMFDEMNEGTAIFKCAVEVPVGAPGSTFVPMEPGVPSDRYLRLAGEAAKMLRKEIPLAPPESPPE